MVVYLKLELIAVESRRRSLAASFLPSFVRPLLCWAVFANSGVPKLVVVVVVGGGGGDVITPTADAARMAVF
jgi:hypothetical protein